MSDREAQRAFRSLPTSTRLGPADTRRVGLPLSGNVRAASESRGSCAHSSRGCQPEWRPGPGAGLDGSGPPWLRRPGPGRGKAVSASGAGLPRALSHSGALPPRPRLRRARHWPRPGCQRPARSHVRCGLHLGVQRELGAHAPGWWRPLSCLPVCTGRPQPQRRGSGHGGSEPGTSAQEQARWLTPRQSHAR